MKKRYPAPPRVRGPDGILRGRTEPMEHPPRELPGSGYGITILAPLGHFPLPVSHVPVGATR